MFGLCSLVKRSQSLKKSDLSVFDTRHLSDQITKQRSTSPALKFKYTVDESSLQVFSSSQGVGEEKQNV